MGKSFVGPLPTISASSASGVWQMDNVFEYRAKDVWPKVLPGLSASNPASSAVEMQSFGVTTSGFYYIQIDGWPSPLQIYCDMVNDDGGWMLWAHKTSSGSSLDVRNTGYFAGYSSGNGHITTDWSNLTTEGHVNMWPYFNGSRKIRWYNNISGVTSSSPGSFVTKVLIAQENGTAMKSSVDFWNLPGNSCVSESRRYTYSAVHVNSGFSNSHTIGSASCTGWAHRGAQAIMNYTANLDCGSCYFPIGALFGNGGSGYYSFGDTYDNDRLSFDMVSSFSDVSIASHSANSNQLWVK